MASSSLDRLKAKMFEDPEVKAEYDRLENEFAVAGALLSMRKSAGLTQAELAQRMQTNRTQVAKIESGRNNTKIDSLVRYAQACGREINWSRLFTDGRRQKI